MGYYFKACKSNFPPPVVPFPPGSGVQTLILFQSVTLANGNNDKPIEESDQVVSPDMLYKLSKKIAQLTKVIYSLNTKNDDLEVDLEAVRNTYEDKLQICQEQLQIMKHVNSCSSFHVTRIFPD